MTTKGQSDFMEYLDFLPAGALAGTGESSVYERQS